MDDLDAPQWADFMAPSPQISVDDYFFKKREHFEYRENMDSVDTDSPNVTNKSIFRQPLSESSYINESILQKTPKRAINAKEKKSSIEQKDKTKRTTYENLLTEAMSNLQLSMKKPRDKSLNKSCLVDYAEYKTPKRVTRSMCAQAMNTPKQKLEKSCNENFSHEKSVRFNDVQLETFEENKENVKATEQEEPMNLAKNDQPLDLTKSEDVKPQSENSNTDFGSPLTDQSSQIHLEITASSTEHEISHEKSDLEHEISHEKSDVEHEISREKSEAEQEVSHSTSEPEQHEEVVEEKLNKSKQFPKGRVVTSFGTKQVTNRDTSKNSITKKKPTALTGTAWVRHVKRRMSLTNQRRVSIIKSQVPGKYISMAEACSKFQRTTPQRFHSTNVKLTRTEQLRRKSIKLTRPQSPALMSKNRIRPVTALSTEEKELLELEKMRQNQIKANPVPKDILLRPAPLKKVEKKMVTNPEPFHLTEVKKTEVKNQPLPIKEVKTQPRPKKEVKTQPLPKKEAKTQEFKRVHHIHHKMAPTVVSADETGVVIKEEEILHYGIPMKAGSKKEATKIKPFSFEARNRELEKRKQEKLKALEEEKKQQQAKAEFHARPMPAAVKTPVSKIPLKNSSAKKPKITITRSLSFESRVKEIQKKKEEKIKQIEEEEKKMRTFKAQKVPEFKPVLVRGRSRDNLLKKSMENLSIKPINSTHNKTADNILKRSDSLKKMQACPMKKALPIPMVAAKKTSPPVVPNENQENISRGAVPKILEPKCKLSQKSVAVLTELNTDKRAKQRKEFEDQLKKKEMMEEEMRKQEEEERIEREKVEKLELRKMAEHKARPMPIYKKMTVLKSNKPLTAAQSPAWAKRKGSSTQ